MSQRLPLAARITRSDFHRGRLSRREFMTRMTALGVAGSTLGSIATAQTPAIRQGGVLRIQQSVRPLRDPRTFDWSELGNQTRGFLEYLVEYQRDGSLTGMLLEGWEVNDDATVYALTLRQGVNWSNGEAFTADHVAHNFARWCDSSVAGNSMAGRLPVLSNPETGQLRDDAIKVNGPHRLELLLSAPDVALMANLSDYPAAVVHPSYEGGDPFAHGIGTGPFRPLELVPGERCILERNPAHPWWGTEVFGGPYVDRVEFLDYGTDPSNWVAAAEAGEIDMLYESIGDFIDVLDGLGWVRAAANTSATCVIRPNQRAEVAGQTPYADLRMRQALQLAVDNEICLELGNASRGVLAANDHVSPIHPTYNDLGPAPYDPAQAEALSTEAGMAGFEHELVTLDDEWQRNTGDAVAAQLSDAGLKVRRTIVPGSEFWENWLDYPFSLTQWNHRPLAIQVLSLAYRSTAAWNESGFNNPEFDALLDQAMAEADVAARKKTMEKIQALMRAEAVIIQPYWRRLYNHQSGALVNAEKHPSHEIHLHKIGFKA